MPSVLVISANPDLYGSVQSAACAARPCECLLVDQWIIDFEDVIEAEAALIVVHVASPEHAREFVGPLAEFCATKSIPIPVIAVVDEFDGPTYKYLLECGVRDCLSRPLDLRRLTFFIDSELVTFHVGESRQFSKQPVDAFELVMQKARRVALTDTTVLLSGETGVGKTRLARYIHQQSHRANHPFVNLNCASLADSLAESELFGHKKGAFTGADDNYEGHFAASGEGTLFLDEIDSLPLALQGKLLHSLDDRTYQAVGSTTQQKLKSRLIAASNVSLESAVNQGTFRRDLFYRLNVVDLKIPSLRERQDEFVDLARTIIAEICEIREIPRPRVLRETWHVLKRHDWPGNIRELRNVLESGMLFMNDAILRPTDLPKLSVRSSSQQEQNPVDARKHSRYIKPAAHEVLDQAAQRDASEKRRVLGTLELCNYNKSQAARTMGISRNGLYKKLKGLGIKT